MRSPLPLRGRTLSWPFKLTPKDSFLPSFAHAHAGIAGQAYFDPTMIANLRPKHRLPLVPHPLRQLAAELEVPRPAARRVPAAAAARCALPRRHRPVARARRSGGGRRRTRRSGSPTRGPTARGRQARAARAAPCSGSTPTRALGSRSTRSLCSS